MMSRLHRLREWLFGPIPHITPCLEERFDIDIVALPEGGFCICCRDVIPVGPGGVIWLNGETYHTECYWGRKRVPS